MTPEDAALMAAFFDDPACITVLLQLSKDPEAPIVQKMVRWALAYHVERAHQLGLTRSILDVAPRPRS